MRLRSLLCFFIIGIKTKAEIKPDLAINYICYNLNNVFSDLKRSIIKFDIYFNLVFKKIKRKECEKIQRLFFKKSYYCLKINEKLILATQNDDSLIRDKIVKK